MEKNLQLGLWLEDMRRRYNNEEHLKLDPLVIAKRYRVFADKEVAAFVCSSFALGSVLQIMKTCEKALAVLGPNPCSGLLNMTDSEIKDAYSGHSYRMFKAKDFIALFIGLKTCIEERHTLLNFFKLGDDRKKVITVAMSTFVENFTSLLSKKKLSIRQNLLPSPKNGSACKRFFLLLRWLVRKDEIDLGGWEELGTERLIIPMDVHMTRICYKDLAFIKSQTSNIANAICATEGFKLYNPKDPVAYDFALTRPSIDPDN